VARKVFFDRVLVEASLVGFPALMPEFRVHSSFTGNRDTAMARPAGFWGERR
jgi:hypothetical protein